MRSVTANYNSLLIITTCLSTAILGLISQNFITRKWFNLPLSYKQGNVWQPMENWMVFVLEMSFRLEIVIHSEGNVSRHGHLWHALSPWLWNTLFLVESISKYQFKIIEMLTRICSSGVKLNFSPLTPTWYYVYPQVVRQSKQLMPITNRCECNDVMVSNSWMPLVVNTCLTPCLMKFSCIRAIQISRYTIYFLPLSVKIDSSSRTNMLLVGSTVSKHRARHHIRKHWTRIYIWLMSQSIF